MEQSTFDTGGGSQEAPVVSCICPLALTGSILEGPGGGGARIQCGCTFIAWKPDQTPPTKTWQALKVTASHFGAIPLPPENELLLPRPCSSVVLAIVQRIDILRQRGALKPHLSICLS